MGPHGDAIPPVVQPAVILAAPDGDALPQKSLPQAPRPAEQQVVGLGRTHPEAQRRQVIREPAPLRMDEGSCSLQEILLRQRRHTGALRQRGYVPRLGCTRHAVQQRAVGAQAVPQPDARHAVALGKGLQDQQLRVRRQKGFGADTVLRKVQEALIQKHPRSPRRTALQDPLQQRQRQQQ